MGSHVVCVMMTHCVQKLTNDSPLKCLFSSRGAIVAETVNKWSQIIPKLPATHALTKYDSTSRMFWIGKRP